MSQLLHVTTTGSDSNSGTVDFPFRTINFGIARIGAGDTLLVGSGIYDESFINNFNPGTSWSNKIRVAAYPGASVWLRPTTGMFVIELDSSSIPFSYIEFDGINMDGRGLPSGIQTFMVRVGSVSLGTGAHHIRFQNLETIGTPSINISPGGPITFQTVSTYAGAIGSNEFLNLTVHGGGESGGTAYGFYLNDSNNIINGCNIYNTCGAGVQLNNDNGGVGNSNIISNNRFHDIIRFHSGVDHNLCVGIIDADFITNTLIYNNLFYRIGNAATFGAAIYLYTGQNAKAYNNTIYGGYNEGIAVDVAALNATIKNNISYNNAQSNFRDDAVGTIKSNNITSINPLFVNVGLDDFRLSTTSPALDAGVTV